MSKYFTSEKGLYKGVVVLYRDGYWTENSVSFYTVVCSLRYATVSRGKLNL